MQTFEKKWRDLGYCSVIECLVTMCKARVLGSVINTEEKKERRECLLCLQPNFSYWILYLVVVQLMSVYGLLPKSVYPYVVSGLSLKYQEDFIYIAVTQQQILTQPFKNSLIESQVDVIEPWVPSLMYQRQVYDKSRRKIWSL